MLVGIAIPFDSILNCIIVIIKNLVHFVIRLYPLHYIHHHRHIPNRPSYFFLQEERKFIMHSRSGGECGTSQRWMQCRVYPLKIPLLQFVFGHFIWILDTVCTYYQAPNRLSITAHSDVLDSFLLPQKKERLSRNLESFKRPSCE